MSEFGEDAPEESIHVDQLVPQRASISSEASEGSSEDLSVAQAAAILMSMVSYSWFSNCN